MDVLSVPCGRVARSCGASGAPHSPPDRLEPKRSGAPALGLRRPWQVLLPTARAAGPTTRTADPSGIPVLYSSPAMLPIPGTSSIAHLEENLASASIRLTLDEFRTLASL